jgi:hypothetical protein
VGNGPGLDVRGVYHERRGACSSLLVGIPFLPLLDQPAIESGPAKGFFILRARCFGAEGFLGVVVRVAVWGGRSPWVDDL